MKHQTLKRLLAFAKPYSKYIVIAIIAAIFQVGLTLVAPIFIGDAVDFIVGENAVNFAGIIPILVLLITVILFAAFAQWILTLATNTLSYHMVHDLRKEAMQTLEKMPLKYLHSHAHGDIISRVITDIDVVSDGLLQGFSQLFTGIMMIVGTIGFMFSIHISITLLVLAITPVSLIVATVIAKKTYHRFQEQSILRGEMSGYIEEMITNQTLVQSFSYEEKTEAVFSEINQRLYTSGVKAQFYSALTNPSTRFINGIVYAVVGIVGAIGVVNGNLTVGQLSAFLTYANQYMKPFNEITGVVTELQAALSSTQRVIELIDTPIEKPDDPQAIDIETIVGNVELKDVAFSYTEETTLIENFNVKVNAGQTIAIVGPTGCGKTTLINLLMRFYEVTEGEILLDGKNIQSITKQSMRRQYGMVLQDTWLFKGTIRENIAYGKPEATELEIEAAAKNAHAHHFIEQLSHGYDTLISEDDSSISQGQKQLLCIARIMLMDPPMLILDEATSNIDTRTEIQIQRAFDKMMEGRTSFIIAHRLSTIKNADSILVMKAGKIIERGTHDELLLAKGFYENLYNSQFKIQSESN